MNPVQTLNLDHLLTARGINGVALARAAELSESHVSKIRNGLRPSKTARDALLRGFEKLEKPLNEHEIRALGWEDADA